MSNEVPCAVGSPAPFSSAQQAPQRVDRAVRCDVDLDTAKELQAAQRILDELFLTLRIAGHAVARRADRDQNAQRSGPTCGRRPGARGRTRNHRPVVDREESARVMQRLPGCTSQKACLRKMKPNPAASA